MAMPAPCLSYIADRPASRPMVLGGGPAAEVSGPQQSAGHRPVVDGADQETDAWLPSLPSFDGVLRQAAEIMAITAGSAFGVHAASRRESFAGARLQAAGQCCTLRAANCNLLLAPLSRPWTWHAPPTWVAGPAGRRRPPAAASHCGQPKPARPSGADAASRRRAAQWQPSPSRRWYLSQSFKGSVIIVALSSGVQMRTPDPAVQQAPMSTPDLRNRGCSRPGR